MSCVTCHDPHEDSRTTLGHATRECTQCHQDHAGPWIYEHPPVTEDCTICHDPHGAVADDLLAVRDPVVCLACHTVSDDRHINTGEGVVTIDQDFPAGTPSELTPNIGFAFYTRCTDCHGNVHGSYQDPHLRR